MRNTSVKISNFQRGQKIAGVPLVAPGFRQLPKKKLYTHPIINGIVPIVRFVNDILPFSGTDGVTRGRIGWRENSIRDKTTATSARPISSLTANEATSTHFGETST